MTADSEAMPRRRDRRGRMAEGFLLGTVITYAIFELGLTLGSRWKDAFLVLGVVGALLALTRARSLLRLLTGLLLIVMFIVGYTPLVQGLMNRMVRADPPGLAPAVVVLSSSVFSDRSLTSEAQERAIKGYELLRQGYAPRLVLTDAMNENGSQVETVARQMKTLGLNYPIEDAGPVVNTHDEALEVAALARKHGWKRVLLVTHPWHMRRAAAVFEKAGIPVLCCPCQEGKFDMHALDDPRVRMRAFRDWLHEALGYRVYQWRGWI